MPGRTIERTVTIADSASLSDEIDLGDAVLVALQPDSAWDTNAVSFQARGADPALGTLKYEGVEVSFAAVAAEDFVTFSPSKFAGVRFLKVRSGTAGSAVNQSGASVVTLILRGM